MSDGRKNSRRARTDCPCTGLAKTTNRRSDSSTKEGQDAAACRCCLVHTFGSCGSGARHRGGRTHERADAPCSALVPKAAVWAACRLRKEETRDSSQQLRRKDLRSIRGAHRLACLQRNSYRSCYTRLHVQQQQLRRQSLSLSGSPDSPPL